MKVLLRVAVPTVPDPEKIGALKEMFRVYNEAHSDYKVRDWLKAHQILTRSGEATWTVSSVRRILTNRRYVAQIEINRENKGIDGLPEPEAYRIVPAPYEPLVSIESFELAQAILGQRSVESPTRIGRPRSFSQTQCNRVYPLQGIAVCGHCGHSMTPWYIKHKAGEDKSGKKRKHDSYIFYYICGQQRKGWKAADHKNCILARRAEEWVLEQVGALMADERVIEAAMKKARQAAEADLAPFQESFNESQKVLTASKRQSEELIQAVASGHAQGALWTMLNDKAAQLQLEQERLLIEQRRLREHLSPLSERFDATGMRELLKNFTTLSAYAEPQELQRLLRLTIRRIEWKSEGNHKVQFYQLPRRFLAKTNCPPAQRASGQK